MLYHLTSKENLESIMREGLKPMIGDSSLIAGEKDPAVYLCRRQDLPYWMILLQRDTILKVDLETWDMDDRTDYASYSEFRYFKPIISQKLSLEHGKIDLREAMCDLCLGHLNDISHTIVLCACYYNDYGINKNTLSYFLNAAIRALNILDYSVLDKREIRDYLSEEGKKEYMLTDAYKNTGKQLYSMLPCYPKDDLTEKREALHEAIIRNLDGCLQGGYWEMGVISSEDRTKS